MVQVTATGAKVRDSGRAEDPVGPWFLRGLCRDEDPDLLFVEGARAQKQARTLCFECPVRVECLAEALDNQVGQGVWGGMTEWERRALLRQHPEVESWFPVLRKIQDDLDEYRESARMKLADLWQARFERENSA